MYSKEVDQETNEYLWKVNSERNQKEGVNKDVPVGRMLLAKRDLPDEEMTVREEIDFVEFNPSISFENTEITYKYRANRPYRLFRKPVSAKMVVTFNVPDSVRNYPSGFMYIHLNHCRTTSDGCIDMKINSKIFLGNYSDAPRDNFGVQTFKVPYTDLSLLNQNQYEIILNSTSPGVYWLSDISFSFEDKNQTRHFGETFPAETNTTGAFYDNVNVTDSYRKGNPYLLFDKLDSTCTIEFFTPSTFYNIEQVNVNLSLNHCATTSVGKVDMLLNGKTYRSNYDDAPRDNFGIQHFDIPFTSLNTDGNVNIFQIKLVGSPNKFSHYWLSDAGVTFQTKKPEVTKSTFESIVKNWILNQRGNIAELSQIPRDDYSAWEFIKTAPSWFYLSFIPASPTEISVLIKHFPTRFITVANDMKKINIQARSFRSDLFPNDLPKKNAHRHAYWMALTTRAYGADFAIALGDAHEYAHVDLTIEGPYDHVTDKINNAVGVELGYHDKKTDCEVLVNHAWDNNQLAWAKNFRVEDGKQTADIFWDLPLKNLAKTYKVIPDFNNFEKDTLKKHGLSIPKFPPIHDEL